MIHSEKYTQYVFLMHHFLTIKQKANLLPENLDQLSNLIIGFEVYFS